MSLPDHSAELEETDPDARFKTKQDGGQNTLLHIFFGRLVRSCRVVSLYPTEIRDVGNGRESSGTGTKI